MFILIFSTTSVETFLIVRRIQRDAVISVHKYTCEIPVIFVRA